MSKSFVILSNTQESRDLYDQLEKEHPDLDFLIVSYKPDKHHGRKYCQVSLGTEVDSLKKFTADSKIVAIYNRAESYVLLHAKLSDALNLPGPSLKSVMLCKDKAALHKMMVENHLATYRPQATVVSFSDSLDYIAKSSLPIVIKPHIGAKSRGVFILRQEEDIETAISYLRGYFDSSAVRISGGEQTVLLEEYLEGQQISSTCFVDTRGKLHTISYVDIFTGKDIGQNHMQLVHRATPSKQPENVTSKIEALLQQIVTLAGLTTTFMHPEFIIRENNPYLVELNIRIGGFRSQLMQHAQGIDLETMATQLALGKTPTYEVEYHKSCTATEVWSANSGIISKFNIPDHANVINKQIFVSEGEYYVSPPANHQPLALYFTVTKNDSLATAQAILDEIQIEIE